MVRNIIKGKKIFGRKAKPATEADQEIVTDLLFFNVVHRQRLTVAQHVDHLAGDILAPL